MKQKHIENVSNEVEVKRKMTIFTQNRPSQMIVKKDGDPRKAKYFLVSTVIGFIHYFQFKKL